MPTYINMVDYIGGVFDKGAGYLLDMQWHLLATGGYDGQSSEKADPQTPPIPPTGLPVTVQLTSNQHREFHYRFIPIPNPLVLNNPPFDTDIPWRLWNTHPLDDTAVTATITGSNVITSDFTMGATLWDGQYKEFNIQVAEGEVEINALLEGDFAQGDFDLTIIGVVVLTVDRVPNDGSAKETWRWNTKVITSWDSTEQRIRYSPAPQREVEFEYDLDEPEIVDLQYRLYRTSTGTLALPYWQYQCYLTADSPVSTNVIFFDPTYTNLKAGDRLYIIDSEIATIQPVIVTVEEMLANGCRITSQLARRLETGWILMPLNSVYTENPRFTMDSITGRFRVRGEVTDRTRVLTRDDVSETLTLYKGLPVLDFKILAGIQEAYEIEFEDLSTSFGARERSVIWEAPKLLRSVSFRVNNKKTLTGYDYATLFFDYCAGQHKPFFVSSELEDLILETPPPNTSAQIQVKGTIYADVYFNSATYQQLEIEFTDGTVIWYTVNTAVTEVGGTSLITLDNALPGDVETNTIVRISYLYRVRLATDEVQVSHQNNRMSFAFSILGTTQ